MLFDREIEERVQVFDEKHALRISISLEQDDADSVDGLSMVLPLHADKVDGRVVAFDFARESEAVQAFCVDWAKGAGASRIDVAQAQGTAVVWPPLLEIASGREVAVRMHANGRTREQILAGLAAEAATHHTVTQSKPVVVDLPSDRVSHENRARCEALR